MKLFNGIAETQSLVYNDLAKQNISHQITIDKSISHLLTLPLTFTRDYYSSFKQDNIPTITSNCSDYFQHMNTQLASLMCPEKDITDIAKKHIQLPTELEQSLSSIQIHVGQGNNFAPIHYDWDFTWVYHVCLMGEKELTFFPPESGKFIAPIINTSSFKIPMLNIDEQKEFRTNLSGQLIKLKAGQAAIFPSIWWHGVKYQSNSIALSIRFEQFPELRALSIFPRSYLLQQICWVLYNSKNTLLLKRVLKSICQIFFVEYHQWQDRYAQLNDLYYAILNSFEGCTISMNAVASAFNAELAIAHHELEFLFDFEPRKLQEPTELVSQKLTEHYNVNTLIPKEYHKKYVSYASSLNKTPS